MTAPNHLLGGFTFTGIFGSLMGINILSEYRLLLILFIGCLLQDIELKAPQLDLDYSIQQHITEIPVMVDINFVALLVSV